MSKLSKSGIEETLNIPSADELTAALAMLNNAQAPLEVIEEDESIVEGDLYLPSEETIEEEMSVEEMKSIVKQVRRDRANVKKEPDIKARQKRLEEISNMSTKYFEDIMDRAFNTEDRFSSELFNAASTCLKVASDAETTLINSDTKMAELQLKKEKQDADLNKMSAQSQTKDIDGETVTMIDRNSLLKELGQDK